jgi:uncharacterized protein YciI
VAKQFVFFYLMKGEAAKIGAIVPAHIDYWAVNSSANPTGGPFADRSGGMILFETATVHGAEQLAHNDPFVIERVIEALWIKEWMPER